MKGYEQFRLWDRITSGVKTCFYTIAGLFLSKKSFGQRFNHTDFNSEGRGTGQAGERT